MHELELDDCWSRFAALLVDCVDAGGNHAFEKY
jgi:hypothetical protein